MASATTAADVDIDQLYACARFLVRTSSAHRFGQLEREDWVQELVLAALEALPKFDPKRGQLMSYLSFRMRDKRRSIMRYYHAEKRSPRGRTVDIDALGGQVFEDQRIVESPAPKKTARTAPMKDQIRYYLQNGFTNKQAAAKVGCSLYWTYKVRP